MAAILPDKKVTDSWTARGAALYFAAMAAESAGLLAPGSTDAAVLAVQSIDWAAVSEVAQGLGLAGIALGFRRLGGQILAALKNPAI